MKIKDRDDDYLKRHFSALVRLHGGKWIVVVKGKKFAIVRRSEVAQAVRKARSKYPEDTPLISPIPTRAQLQCILSHRKH